MHRSALWVLCISAMCASGAACFISWSLGWLTVAQAIVAFGAAVFSIVCALLVSQLLTLKSDLQSLSQILRDHEDQTAVLHTQWDERLDVFERRIAEMRRDLVTHLQRADHAASSLADVKDVTSSLDTEKHATAQSPEQSIADAILSNRIDLFVQPIVTLPNQKTVFYECLSRLRSETGDILYPSTYLDHAIRAKLIGTLDNFLLLRCAQIIRRLQRKAPLETFFLNISAASLSDPEFYDQFIDFLSNDSSLAANLVLELNVGDMTTLLPRIKTGMQILKRSGYLLSLDCSDVDEVPNAFFELGAGFVKLPARTILRDPDKSMSSAKQQDAALIAAHVEDSKTLFELNDLGIQYAQGFQIARPQAWDTIDKTPRLRGAA